MPLSRVSRGADQMNGGTDFPAGTSKYVFIKVNDDGAGQRLDKFLTLKDLGL